MLKKSAETNLPHFLAAAKDWETDEIARTKASERRAWRVAMVAVGLAIVLALAVVLLTPLKTVEPFIVREGATGTGEAITLVRDRKVSESEVTAKYWLAQYVNFREEYSKPASYGNYRATDLLSARPVFEPYFQQINPENPNSPTTMYGTKGTIEARVTNITFIGTRHAQVRFVKRVQPDTDVPVQETRWIATVTYEFLNPPIKEEDRLINPLGFQVTSYRLDPETVGVTGGQ